MRNQSGVNSRLQKQRNHGLVLKLVSTGEAGTRIDLSHITGLTKMAVTNIVGELIASGYIEEKETDSNTLVGRNPVKIDISDSAPRAIGVYISRLSVGAVVADMKMRILYRKIVGLENENVSSLTDKLIEVCNGAFDFCEDKSRICAIGVSSIGPLDSVKGMILNPREFFGIKNYRIADILTAQYGLPVFVDNDMNAAALAENLYGCGKKFGNFIYLGLTAGVGAGIVTQGELYQNRSSFAGEIGHMSVDNDGEFCTCGQRGCLEIYASMPSLLRRLRIASGKHDINYRDIAALRDDEICKPVFDNLIRNISIALTNVCNLLDPQCIVIGHEGVYLPDGCLAEIEKTVNSSILAAKYRTVRLVYSTFREDAMLAGSACCVWQAKFDGRL